MRFEDLVISYWKRTIEKVSFEESIIDSLLIEDEKIKLIVE